MSIREVSLFFIDTSNTKNESIMKDYFSLLCGDRPLFQKLKRDNPEWWQFVKKNLKPGGFYVDVRKDNSLNVYYNGGSLLKITLSQEGEIVAKIHEYYLGRIGTKYVDFPLEQLKERAAGIKKQIASRYNDTSESGIKARLICTPGARYIDSEFAFPETRIDLTKLEEGKIIFVELKRIQDSRLLTNEYEDGKPEILEQLKAYHRFIADHRDDITDYYKRLFAIKRDLGILPEALADINSIDSYELSENVELLIESYTDLNPRRTRRIEAVKTILNKNGIIFTIYDHHHTSRH
jgi:hypothetical protein